MKQGAGDTAQFGWYEAGLPLGERKQRGHFSTPPALVEQILDACGYTSAADLSHLRLLDPACGSGNFLACAARRLALSGQAHGLPASQIGKLVQRNIWGLDPDPVACLLAEMQVRVAVTATCRVSSRAFQPHIHQADSLILPWQPCVDLLVANPPYLATKNNDLSHYSRALQRGQADSYLLFLELALQVVRPGGWIGLVLPDPVLARANAALERAHLLRECTLHHIWHLAGVFAAEVGAVVLVGQKLPPCSQHHIFWMRTRWHEQCSLYPADRPDEQSQAVAQAILRGQPGAELRYLLNSGPGPGVERLRRALYAQHGASHTTSRLLPLEQLAEIRRGEELGRRNPALLPLKALEDGYPVLRGGIDVRPYVRPASAWGIARGAVRKPLEHYLAPKLLIVKSTERLQATLDLHGHVVLQTLYLLRLRPPHRHPDGYYFLLALLNSRLLRDYVAYLHTTYKLVQPQIEQTVLARLPIAWAESDVQQEIATRARHLERACSETGPVVEWGEPLTSLYEEQERAIRALYAITVPEIFDDKGVIVYD
ncbi:MAG TPA: N-6 DNA methylase [Ktedonobacteraceae bacterium]|nr:N-6 DNA methylase [Ktedonobacteraceae bacterium]